MGRTIETYVEVDVGEFDDDVLIEELRSRGFAVSKAAEVEPWTRIADAFHFGRSPEQVLADLIYENTGRIVTVSKAH